MSQITLFDLPSKEPCQSWSGNALKTRIALNFKNIPYKTEWIPYYRLQETLKSKGITPNAGGASFADFTIPAIQLTDGTYVMDSDIIAPKLEEIQPTPSLHLDVGLHKKVYKILGSAFPAFVPYFMPRVNRDLVVPEDYDWFHADRSKRFGGDIFELEKAKGPTAMKAAKPGLDAMAKMLRDNKKDEGPFLLGSVPSYGDIVIVAALHMFKRLGDDAFDAFCEDRVEFRELYKACGPWLEKMD